MCKTSILHTVLFYWPQIIFTFEIRLDHITLNFSVVCLSVLKMTCHILGRTKETISGASMVPWFGWKLGCTLSTGLLSCLRYPVLFSFFFQNNLGFQLEYSSISLSLFLKKRLFYVLYATTVLYFIQKNISMRKIVYCHIRANTKQCFPYITIYLSLYNIPVVIHWMERGKAKLHRPQNL